MAYTTEEQDFQSFMQKLKQALPLIVLGLSVLAITYAGISWYKSYTETQTVEQYEEYQRIITSTSGENENLDLRSQLLTKYAEDHPKKSLAAIGLLSTAHEFVARGNYQKALELVSQIPEENEYFPELVAIDKAKIQLQLGQGANSIIALDKIKEGPWYVNARALAGDIYYSLLKYDQSLAEYIKARDYLEKVKAETNKEQKEMIENYETQIRYIQSRLNIVQSMIKNSRLGAGNIDLNAMQPSDNK